MDKTYLKLLDYIIHNGDVKSDRTGTGTISVFGPQMTFDLKEGFPLCTTKKTHFKSIVHELLWIISGDTNIGYLTKNGVSIWSAWADENGDLGPVYGKQWRDFNGVDQLSILIDQLKSNPDSRRHIVSAWNPVDVPNMALPPCHTLFQFYVSSRNELSCKLYQRSADMFLGVPFNIASYALLTHLIAKECGYSVGKFIWTAGDAHIYANHVDAVRTQLTRKPFKLPKLEIRDDVSFFDIKYDDITLVGYESHEAIKAPIAV